LQRSTQGPCHPLCPKQHFTRSSARVATARCWPFCWVLPSPSSLVSHGRDPLGHFDSRARMGKKRDETELRVPSSLEALMLRVMVVAWHHIATTCAPRARVHEAAFSSERLGCGICRTRVAREVPPCFESSSEIAVTRGAWQAMARRAMMHPYTTGLQKCHRDCT